jgi:hypothetical protein
MLMSLLAARCPQLRCALSATATILSAERRSAIQADFDRPDLAIGNIDMSQHPARRLDPPFEAIERRLL